MEFTLRSGGADPPAMRGICSKGLGVLGRYRLYVSPGGRGISAHAAMRDARKQERLDRPTSCRALGQSVLALVWVSPGRMLRPASSCLVLSGFPGCREESSRRDREAPLWPGTVRRCTVRDIHRKSGPHRCDRSDRSGLQTGHARPRTTERTGYETMFRQAAGPRRPYMACRQDVVSRTVALGVVRQVLYGGWWEA